ncbi:TetR/AcrR family transcriptional regulator [Pseudothermotoga sp. U03pept]|uniref:TetR/AcrR family transcriptional regulator n=1 Tax=Pseudothermotoga sp. U03pept TaxID=3447012 RepID=UPI003F02C6AE
MSDARERILEAARAAFSERGFEGVSVEEIAQRAGVRKALIYYYFPSKEVLFEEVWNNALEELERHIFKEIEGESYYIRKIKRFLKAYIDFVTSRKILSSVIERERPAVLSASNEDSNTSWFRLKERYDVFVEKVAKLIDEGKENKVVHPDVDSRAAAKLIAQAMSGSSATEAIQTLILRGLIKES